MSLIKSLFVLLLGVNVFCAVQVIQLTSAQARVKRDYANVNSVRFGLFSMDTWKSHFEQIVSRSILNVDLSPQDEAVLKKEIEKVVRLMILQADSLLTGNQKTLRRKVRKVAYKALVDVPQLVKKSPQFAQAVVNEIMKPESLERLRVLALSQLNKHADQTRNNDDSALSLASLLATYHASTIDEFNAAAPTLIHSLENKIRLRIGVVIGTVLLTCGLWWYFWNRPLTHTLLYGHSVALAAIVLITSLSIPMLDVDARIQSIDLMLLGERIQFANQVLYYRSKSILEVVYTLVVSGKGATILVGLLLFLFSVIFPLAKLTSALLWLSGRPFFRTNRWVNFFAYHSGKWSMADVMVVAIFMSYTGFSSMLNDQLKGLNVSSESWQMITTNATSLQPGFFLFLTFVLFGLALSEILKRIVTPRLTFQNDGKREVAA